jgi:hypothetical protein
MNLIVIANCHVQPICDGLSLSPDIKNIFPIPYHLKGTTHYTDAIEKIKISTEKKFNILQFNNLLDSVDLGQDFPAKIDQLISFTNIFFTGLHPDMTYIGSLGKRILSPLGDYHSKICLLSYLKGYSVEKSASLFNTNTYEKLNFFNIWEESAKELISRDTQLDIKFALEFLSTAKQEAALFTFNHPLATVFNKLLKNISKYLGVRYADYPASYFYNYLANNAWWPIYQEIGDCHKIPYSTPMLFKSPDHLAREMLDLANFISKSYKSYLDQGLVINNLPETVKSHFEFI